METGRPLAAPERARRQPGRCSRGDPAPARLAAESRPRPLRGAAGTARAEGRGGGGWGRAGRKEGRGGGSGGGGRRSASRGRGASATDTCLQGSASARARRSERVRLLPAGWAAALAEPVPLLLPLFLLARGALHRPRGVPAPGPLGGPGAVPSTTAGKALDSPLASLADGSGRCPLAGARTRPQTLAAACRLLLRFIPGSRCRFGWSGSPPAPHSCLRPGGQARGGQALRRLLPPQPFLTSPTRALAIYSLYCSLFPCERPGQQRDRPISSRARASPARPSPASRPIRRCAPALPGFAAGSEPLRGGNNQWAAESKGGPAGTLGFASPTFLSPPTGMCSSSSRPLALRGNTIWGPKNYKSLHPPRRKRERRGAGRSGARRLEMRTNKGNGGGRLWLPGAGYFTRSTRSLSDLCCNPARPYCVQFRERSTCQRSQSAPVVEMKLNPEP
ncbi:translation initiation factor IF-2 [Lutra lutra]|uniref:translation initiation factor IF-2 n=1 Tax=Lutra lutra TaxID=9657 RepID=UPI001FD22C48|nr:translation initiation factor IF-2 [Lutra lutra]